MNSKKDANTNYLEIEKKFPVSEKTFSSLLKKISRMKHKDWYYVEGTDTYYINGTTNLRMRLDDEMCELTYKGRYSSGSSLIREESDIRLPLKDNGVRSIIKFIRNIKFKKLFRIRKDNYVFKFKEKAGLVVVSLYKVECKNKKDRYFAEIETQKGIPTEESLKLISKYQKMIGLDGHKAVNKTLFEIYSGLETEVIGRAS